MRLLNMHEAPAVRDWAAWFSLEAYTPLFSKMVNMEEDQPANGFEKDDILLILPLEPGAPIGKDEKVLVTSSDHGLEIREGWDLHDEVRMEIVGIVTGLLRSIGTRGILG